MKHMERIGVQELRQHAGRYLARVAAGESIEITDRGRPVAHLVPVAADPSEELVRQGVITPAAAGADLLDIRPGTTEDENALSDALAALRAEER